jgi:hypothetical protein
LTKVRNEVSSEEMSAVNPDQKRQTANGSKYPGLTYQSASSWSVADGCEGCVWDCTRSSLILFLQSPFIPLQNTLSFELDSRALFCKPSYKLGYAFVYLNSCDPILNTSIKSTARSFTLSTLDLVESFSNTQLAVSNTFFATSTMSRRAMMFPAKF